MSKLFSRTVLQCVFCRRRIPRERLEALPDVRTCVDCSDEQPRTANDVDLDGAGDRTDMARTVSQPRGER